MARLTIRDDAVWIKHIEQDEGLVRKIISLPQNAPIKLIVDGEPVLFQKMRDGADGRPTQGLRPHPSFKNFWKAMQQRRGEEVMVSTEENTVSDPYLASLSPLLSEWDSPEDAEAYDGL